MNHLYRLHNRIGYNIIFNCELSWYFKVFFREITTRPSKTRAAAPGSVDPSPDQDEAKAALSSELYQKLCKWFFELGTMDGIFAQTYLVLTWNLICRINNTAMIKMADIEWSKPIDCFQTYFSHSKTDQTGEISWYPRHLFSNPYDVLVCPVTAISNYFTTCFNCTSCPNYLFPGKSQEIRFSRILRRMLEQHQVELQNDGVLLREIGTHSICKGGATYLTSLPGGPSIAFVLLRGGWSMGHVRDRYCHYLDSGDQYVGWCLSLLPISTVEFACSPPYFNVEHDSLDDCWLSETTVVQYPVFSSVPQFGRLLRMCLASM